MFNVKDYLSKFAKLTPPDDSLKKFFIRLVEKELKITLDKKSLKLQNKIFYLTASPIIKNEIFLKKNILLEKLKVFSPNETINDIR